MLESQSRVVKMLIFTCFFLRKKNFLWWLGCRGPSDVVWKT